MGLDETTTVAHEYRRDSGQLLVITYYNEDLAGAQLMVFPFPPFFRLVLRGSQSGDATNESTDKCSGGTPCSEEAPCADRAHAGKDECYEGHSCNDTHWCANERTFFGGDRLMMLNVLLVHQLAGLVDRDAKVLISDTKHV